MGNKQLSDEIHGTFKAFEDIRQVSATTGKAEILKQNFSNNVLRNFLDIIHQKWIVG